MQYYIDHNSWGPTKGLPWDYVAPDEAFVIHSLAPRNDTSGSAAAPPASAQTAGAMRSGGGFASRAPGAATGAYTVLQPPGAVFSEQAVRPVLTGGATVGGNCPEAVFREYRSLRESGLPVGTILELEAACRGLLEAWVLQTVGPGLYHRYLDSGILDHPEVRYLFEQSEYINSAPKWGDGTWETLKALNGRPVPALLLDAGLDYASSGSGARGAVWDSETVDFARAAYLVYDWVIANAGRFPVVFAGTPAGKATD